MTCVCVCQEQADLKLRAGELKQKEEVVQKEKENLEKLRGELEEERERLNAAALHLKHRAQEVETLSKVTSLSLTHTQSASCMSD